MPEAVGQLNMYLNFYNTEVNDETDNEAIGIILYLFQNEFTNGRDSKAYRIIRGRNRSV